MISRQQYEEHSERDFLTVPLASYHFDEVTIPLHWHREVELILTETAGSIELEGQSCPYSAGDILCINKGILHRTSEPMGKADPLVFDLRILLSPLLEHRSVQRSKNSSMVRATPSSALEGAICLARARISGIAFSMAKDSPAHSSISASFQWSPNAITSSRSMP